MKAAARLLALGLVLAPAAACRGAGLPENELRGKTGYVSRPCGFDLDRDGVFGEAEDCHVCDGRTSDPDGDGQAENLVYVDCGDVAAPGGARTGGRDEATCGAPEKPCASLDYAFRERAGAAGGPESIFCFRGVCRPSELEPRFGGQPGTYRLPAEGHQARDFEAPRDPAMLVGWDHDHDGDYPPHDPDDLAVLDGGPPPPETPLPGTPPPGTPSGAAGGGPPPAGLTFAFRLGARASYFEMAHFQARDYGRFSAVEQSGFLVFGSREKGEAAHRADAFFFHDLALDGINAGQPAQSHRIVFNYFTSSTRFHHLLFRNLEIRDAGGFLVRGSGPERPGGEAEGGNDGPLRWQNLGLTARGCNASDPACVAGGGSAFIGWKLWGYIDGIEVLDSVFDANVAAWEPKPDGNGGALFVNATQCSRGWTIRGNRLRDFKVALIAQGGNGAYCGYDPPGTEKPRKKPRPTGDVLFADNLFWNTYGPWRSGDMLVQLKGGDDPNRTLGEVTVRDNVLASSDGFDACIRIDVGNAGGPPPGRIAILGNTCWGSREKGRATGLWIGNAKAPEFVQEKIELRGNLFAGFGPEDENLRLDAVPRELTAGGNVFDPEAAFELGGRKLPNLEALAREGVELHSRACEARLEDPGAGRFGLAAGADCRPQ